MSKHKSANTSGAAIRINKNSVVDDSAFPKMSTAPMIAQSGTKPEGPAQYPGKDTDEATDKESLSVQETEEKNTQQSEETRRPIKPEAITAQDDEPIFGRVLTKKEELIVNITKELLPAVASCFPGNVNAGRWDLIVEEARKAAVEYIAHMKFKALEQPPVPIRGFEDREMPYGLTMAGRINQ